MGAIKNELFSYYIFILKEILNSNGTVLLQQNTEKQQLQTNIIKSQYFWEKPKYQSE